METPFPQTRTGACKPGLAAFAVLGAAWALVPVILGAYTTTINAGMAFPDWPLSNGSLNPSGWLSDRAMFAEHSHRLSVGVLIAITLALAAWVWRTESRAWLRRLSLFGIVLILVQAVLGGLRVRFDSQVLAMLHACVAQVAVCTFIAISVGCSRSWHDCPVLLSPRVRRLGIGCCALLFVQLGIGAVMRHSFAGLAIPSFPWSTPEGGILPVEWNFRVAIHFAHRAMALVVTVFLLWFAAAVWRQRAAPAGIRLGALVLAGLLALQIFLGAEIIRTYRDPVITTGHVLIGALTLAATFWLTLVAHRDRIET